MTLRRIAASRACAPLVAAAERCLRGRLVGALEVWTYHRVAGTPTLAEHFDLLARESTPVSIDAVLDAFRGVRSLPERASLVTFDDGYRDLSEVAWPLLQARGIPALLFVPTGFVGGGPFWWDLLGDALQARDRGRLDLDGGRSLQWNDLASRRAAWKALRVHLKRLGPRELDAEVQRLDGQLGAGPGRRDLLDWPDLRELERSGLDLAPHGVHHWMLPTLDAAEQRSELAGSLAALEEHLVRPAPVVAYPAGHYSPTTLEATRACGLELGFTTLPGLNRVGLTDPLRLHRIDVPDGTGVRELRLRRLRAAALGSAPDSPARWTG